jgi:hypothetical protein
VCVCVCVCMCIKCSELGTSQKTLKAIDLLLFTVKNDEQWWKVSSMSAVFISLLH